MDLLLCVCVCVCVCVRVCVSKWLTLASIRIVCSEIEVTRFTAITLLSFDISSTFTRTRYDSEVNRVIFRETDSVVCRASRVTLTSYMEREKREGERREGEKRRRGGGGGRGGEGGSEGGRKREVTVLLPREGAREISTNHNSLPKLNGLHQLTVHHIKVEWCHITLGLESITNQ